MRELIEKEKTERYPERDGGVAQLGEHLPCKQGVMGSNPIISIEEDGEGPGVGREGNRDGLIAQQVRARA